MLKRVVHLSAASFICILATACAAGSEDDGGFTTFSTGFDTQADNSDQDDMDTTGDGDGDPTTTGDGDGDPTTTGDGDPTTTGDGDGDPTTTGDGDGDPTTTGDGDGDGDPGPNCGNGVVDPGETCDGNDFGGVTCVDLGYDQGALTCTGCAVDPSSCMNAPQPGLGQLYSHCLMPESCVTLTVCATVTMQGQMTPFDGYCTKYCTSDAECQANVGGTAVPQCNDEPMPYCELDCSGGKTCPGGMECFGLQGGKFLCY